MSIQSLPGVANLLEQFATFRYSLFRLETLQVYGGSGEEEGLAAFQAGEPIPLTPALREWTQMVRQRVSSGDGSWPQDVPHGDFWLIDSSELWRQH